MRSFTMGRLLLLLLFFPLLSLDPRPVMAEKPPATAASTGSDEEDNHDRELDAPDADRIAQAPPTPRSDILAPAPPPADVDQDPLLDAAEKGRPDPVPKAEPGEPPPRDFYVKPRGYRIIPESDPSRYVRNAAKTGWPLLEDAPWLDLGLEHRMRFEYRQNSFLRTPQEGWDYPFFLRTRLYVAVKEVLDPFRFAFEFQDSRWENSNYPNSNREVNEREPITMYGELHFKNAIGNDRPVYIRGGRMNFELTDRRLIANNEFRNTTNTFQGVRIHAGKMTQEFEADLFAMQPLDRLMYEFDDVVDNLWLYGGTASIRRWSEYATVQPYWFGLTQGIGEDVAETPDDTYSIQTTGIRTYGIVARNWDWDVDLVYQWGSWKNDLDQNAWASAFEFGYTFLDAPWVPRLSGFFAYGSGDKNPDDDQNNNFNSLYGFNQPWSRNDYFSWDNAIQPKFRVEAAPTPDVLIDAGFGAFWLASARAPWQRAELSDPSGKSGTWLGTEYDIRIRWRIWKRIYAEGSYSRFNPGTFPTNLGKGLPSNFFYLQVAVNPFE
jgi:hypothetical protein